MGIKISKKLLYKVERSECNWSSLHGYARTINEQLYSFINQSDKQQELKQLADNINDNLKQSKKLLEGEEDVD